MTPYGHSFHNQGGELIRMEMPRGIAKTPTVKSTMRRAVVSHFEMRGEATEATAPVPATASVHSGRVAKTMPHVDRQKTERPNSPRMVG